jgi:hypothetical protein
MDITINPIPIVILILSFLWISYVFIWNYFNDKKRKEREARKKYGLPDSIDIVLKNRKRF